MPQDPGDAMRNVLAIECSCPLGSVTVLKDGAIVKSWEFESPRGRGTELFALLESALRGPGRPDLVVAGTGPGRSSACCTCRSAEASSALASGGLVAPRL